MLSSVMSRLNDRRDGAADLGEDAGFTLIELMVVLLILAILLAIAIPTFLGVTGGANDRAAQSNLNTAITTAKAAAANNNQTYSGVDLTTLSSNEPSIKWTSGNVYGNQGQVSAAFSSDGQGVVLASYSKNNNTCWYAADNQGKISAALVTGGYNGPDLPGVFYAHDSTGTCNASAATATQASWTSSFSG